MHNPNLDYVLPAFNIPYCIGSALSLTIPFSNTGDSTAMTGTLAVNLAPFNVTVAPGASYDGSAFHLPPIAAGGNYNLVFTLTLPVGSVCSAPASGSFSFNLDYYDRCGNLYETLPRTASWQLTNTPGSVSVTKTMPSEVYRGQIVTATISVNPTGLVGSVRVTDTVPAGWCGQCRWRQCLFLRGQYLYHLDEKSDDAFHIESGFQHAGRGSRLRLLLAAWRPLMLSPSPAAIARVACVRTALRRQLIFSAMSRCSRPISKFQRLLRLAPIRPIHTRIPIHLLAPLW